MLELVELASDRIGELAGLNEDARHWVSVAVRESVINAIKHGNKDDASKTVTIEFTLTPLDKPAEMVVSIRDQGESFDPGVVADPRDPENILKPGGRGIFFMCSFMDEVTWQPAPGGGTEVRMMKKLRP